MNAIGANAYLSSVLSGDPMGPAGSLGLVNPAGPQGWFNQLRAEGLERANALTVPTLRDEEWRFTDLSPLYRLAFRPSRVGGAIDAATLATFAIPEATTRLVFVDGIFAASLSTASLVGGIIVAPLASALSDYGTIIRERLGQIAPIGADAFRAINTAYLSDGALILARRNASSTGPIHVLNIATQSEAAIHNRTLVIAESGADVTVIEDFVATGEGVYCVNAVSEIDVADNARVRVIKLQREGAKGFHLASRAARVQRDGVFSSNAITLGGRISRETVGVSLSGAGADCQLDGLTLINERQLADTHSFIDHREPHCTSRQLHKCVVGDAAHAVFNGRILVRQDAQKTNSAQESRNLLLSQRAHVDTKPQLEILADDVKCSHGATVGQLDAEEMFYLRSRGLPEAQARNVLTYAFAAEVVDRIAIPSVVERLHEAVMEQTRTKDSL
ncbi:MAG: Fe-S cluster assembly protein SufD [Burkholderiales bacterium]